MVANKLKSTVGFTHQQVEMTGKNVSKNPQSRVKSSTLKNASESWNFDHYGR